MLNAVEALTYPFGFEWLKVAGVRNGEIGTGLWKYVDKLFASNV